MKDYFLLSIRLYFGISLFYFAEQGGLAKFNWGVEGISENLVAPLGFPFNAFPLVFSYLVVAAEFLGPLLMLTGFMSQLGSFLLSGSMAVATYAHVIVWKNGLWSTIENAKNVHGCLIYFAFATYVFLNGPGRFTLASMISGESKKKSN
jgi:uncharacterized membrane protein YphA (DoxX/SURF4 family)